MSKSIRFIGMDVHKNSIAIAIADEGRQGEVRHYGTIDNNILDPPSKKTKKLVGIGKAG